MSLSKPDCLNYPIKATLDLKAAMAKALATRLLGLFFVPPSGGLIQFTRVYDQWPSFPDNYVSPVAAVLPTPTRYDASRMTPALLEDTWEPKHQVGCGLYKLADVEADFEILVRTASVEERTVIMAGVEESFQSDGVLMDPLGAIYGVNLPMPEYWNLVAGFALKASRVLDDEDRAMREHREAVFTVTGWAPQVKLAPVRPMRPTVRLVIDGV